MDEFIRQLMQMGLSVEQVQQLIAQAGQQPQRSWNNVRPMQNETMPLAERVAALRAAGGRPNGINMLMSGREPYNSSQNAVLDMQQGGR